MRADLVGLRMGLLTRGWTDHEVEEADDSFIYMIHRPDRAINWNTVFVADNGYVSLGSESLSLDGQTVERGSGFAIHHGASDLWEAIGLIGTYASAAFRRTDS
jgi:hypothetical protein